MKKNALTLRQKKIIEILTSPNNTDFITISNIAEKLGLSNRTVLRGICLMWRNGFMKMTLIL